MDLDFLVVGEDSVVKEVVAEVVDVEADSVDEEEEEGDSEIDLVADRMQVLRNKSSNSVTICMQQRSSLLPKVSSKTFHISMHHFIWKIRSRSEKWTKFSAASETIWCQSF